MQLIGFGGGAIEVMKIMNMPLFQVHYVHIPMIESASCSGRSGEMVTSKSVYTLAPNSRPSTLIINPKE